MDDPLSFGDVLLGLSPLLAALWVWGLGRVLQDLRRPTATGPALARCGLPGAPLPPAPLHRFLATRRVRARYPHGHPAR